MLTPGASKYHSPATRLRDSDSAAALPGAATAVPVRALGSSVESGTAPPSTARATYSSVTAAGSRKGKANGVAGSQALTGSGSWPRTAVDRHGFIAPCATVAHARAARGDVRVHRDWRSSAWNLCDSAALSGPGSAGWPGPDSPSPSDAGGGGGRASAWTLRSADGERRRLALQLRVREEERQVRKRREEAGRLQDHADREVHSPSRRA